MDVLGSAGTHELEMGAYQPHSLGAPEAWRCDACGSLIYNVDEQGYPAAGAPMPHYWNVSKPAVCAVCYALGNNLATNEYWVALHREWRQEEANAKQNKDKLTGKRDYFTGM